MAFKLGDTIVDRVQFAYGAKSSGTPLYVLTQCSNANIEITADSTDIKDRDGNLIYRKYSGKTGTVTITNAFFNTSIVETLSAADAEIATADHTVEMPMMKLVKAGETLDITGYVEGSVIVSALGANGTLGKEYKLGAGTTASATEFAVKHTDAVQGEPATPAKDELIPPTDKDEVQYFVKFKKLVASGAKITISGDKNPKAHELFLKALIVDPCDKENYKAAVIYIPSFMPSPELTMALEGGDSQTMEFTGAMMLDYCSTNKELCSVFVIDEVEE